MKKDFLNPKPCEEMIKAVIDLYTPNPCVRLLPNGKVVRTKKPKVKKKLVHTAKLLTAGIR